MHDNDPGTGRTTRQMEAAPKGALFIWCNDSLDYPRDLARRICRTDLVIVGLSALENGACTLRGRTFSGVGVDHAANLDHIDRLNGYRYVLAQVRP